MSPLATCPSSWASTARTSLGANRWINPLLTATSASLRFQPVAKAFAELEGKIPTSGIFIPASVARLFTVSSSHCSSLFWGSLIRTVPVPRLASHLDNSSEINAPPKPKRAQNTKSADKLRSMPLASSTPLNPSRLKIKLTKTKTARLVPKNKRIRNFKCLQCDSHQS